MYHTKKRTTINPNEKLTYENTKNDFITYGIYFIPDKTSNYIQTANTELKLYNVYFFEVPIKVNHIYCTHLNSKDYNLSFKLFNYAATELIKSKPPNQLIPNPINTSLVGLHKYLIELYANLLQEAGINNTNVIELIEILKSKKPIKKTGDSKPKKKTIPPLLKIKVWNKHIGEEIGKAKCLCCKLQDIFQASFSCGHIIAESNGGELKLDNLKPICASCNSSMGIKNMNDYIQEFGF